MSDPVLSLGQLAQASCGLTREVFKASHPAPFLVRLEEEASSDRRTTASPVDAPRFQTAPLSEDRARIAAGPSGALEVHELKKRAGANAFLHMVTIGRAANNDIVLGHERISKFHASFTRAATGAWFMTDASTNGTWVDGERLELHMPALVRTGSTIDLANTVLLVLLSPTAMFDELERVRRAAGSAPSSVAS